MTKFKKIENKEQDGIEIYFEEKPQKKTMDFLKENHFRWHKVKKCWYAKNNSITTKAIEQLEKDDLNLKKEPKKQEFKFNVKVGDVFYISWGYDQTNLDFFQIKELVGTTSARIVEVVLETKEETMYEHGMARDVSFNPENASVLEKSFWIKDQEKGDLVRIKSWSNNPNDADCPSFKVAGRYEAEKYNGTKLYESWYA